MATIAKFDVCACGQHGRIVIDSVPGDEVFLQRVARIAAYCAYERGKLNWEQLNALYREIDASSVSRRNDEIDQRLSHLVRVWNANRKCNQLSPSDFHAFFARSPSL